MANYEIVATFYNEIDAELAQATLMAAGIESYMEFEPLGSMLPSIQETEGVKLLVDSSQLEEAKTLLSEQAKTED